MEHSLFFNSINGDRKYNADDWAKYFALFIGNGVYAKHENALTVTPGEGLSVVIGTGAAFLNGYAYLNDTPLVKSMDIADGLLKRIDRIVIRYSLNERQCRAVVLKGALSQQPAAAEIIRNSEYYDLAIADVLIDKGSIHISQADIRDLRADKGLCGFVAHVLQSFDVDGMYAQFAAQFQSFFAQLKETLSGDVAGNLSNLIAANTQRIADARTELLAAVESNTPIKTRYVDETGEANATAAKNIYMQARNPVTGKWEWLTFPLRVSGVYRTFDTVMRYDGKVVKAMVLQTQEFNPAVHKMFDLPVLSTNNSIVDSRMMAVRILDLLHITDGYNYINHLFIPPKNSGDL